MKRLRRLLFAVAVAATLAVPAGAHAANVFAAASLREAFPALDANQTYSFAGSNQLQLQIERGAHRVPVPRISPTRPPFSTRRRD